MSLVSESEAPSRSVPDVKADDHSIASADHKDLRVLVWNWGKIPAKFTIELLVNLQKQPGLQLSVSVAEGPYSAHLPALLPHATVFMERTFNGDKSRLSGKFSAALGLANLPRLAWSFSRRVQSLKPDLTVCAMNSIWDIAALPFLSGCGRFVFVAHDAEIHPGDDYLFRQHVLNAEFAAADALLTLSEHVERSVQTLYGFPKERIWKVPHGSLDYSSRPQVARRFPGERPMRLLFFGRLVRYKGLHHLLDAYDTLRQGGLPVELAIVGEGDLSPYRDRIATLPDVSALNRYVADEEIAALLADADLMMLPYIEASQSGVAALSLAAGLPIVATPVGGLVEQVCHEKTGLIAGSMTSEDFAAAIRRLVETPDLYEALSRNALAHARDALGWEHIGEAVANVLHQVAEMPPRRQVPRG